MLTPLVRLIGMIIASVLLFREYIFKYIHNSLESLYPEKFLEHDTDFLESAQSYFLGLCTSLFPEVEEKYIGDIKPDIYPIFYILKIDTERPRMLMYQYIYSEEEENYIDMYYMSIWLLHNNTIRMKHKVKNKGLFNPIIEKFTIEEFEAKFKKITSETKVFYGGFGEMS